jgi:hypothetical protein
MNDTPQRALVRISVPIINTVNTELACLNALSYLIEHFRSYNALDATELARIVNYLSARYGK